MHTKYKNLTEQEFRVIRALTSTHKTAEVARITGRSYPLVKWVQSVENFDEYRNRKQDVVEKEVPYMDQMLGLLTEIRDELRNHNIRIDARIYEETNKKKRSWF